MEDKIIISVNKTTGEVNVEGELHSLSKNEVLLLELLNSNPGVIYSAEDISIACWPGRVVSASSVPVAVKRVRDFLKKTQLKSRIITHKGAGYSFLLEDNIEIIFGEMDLDKSVNPVRNEVTTTSSYNSLAIIVISLSVCFFSWFFYSALEWDEISVRYGNNNKQVISSANSDDIDMSSLKAGESIYIDQSNHSVICNEKDCLAP